MSNLEALTHIEKAREAASAVAYDIQQFAADTPERQAIHNLSTAIDTLILTVQALADDE
jgi:hypothetical protein